MRTSAFLVLLAILPVIVSCAHVPQPPSKDARAAFGRVGIYAPPPEDINFEAPTSGRIAGAGKGTLGAIEGVASSAGGGDAWLGVALLSPVFALGGFIYGAAAAEPASAVQGWQDAVMRAVDGVDIGQGLRDGIVQKAKERGIDIAVVDAVPPVGSKPDCRSICTMGIDTLIEAQVLHYGLDGDGIDPPVQFVAEARVRVIRTSDCSVIYTDKFRYNGQEMTYAHWAAMTVVLRNQINAAVANISGQTVDKVFLATE